MLNKLDEIALAFQNMAKFDFVEHNLVRKFGFCLFTYSCITLNQLHTCNFITFVVISCLPFLLKIEMKMSARGIRFIYSSHANVVVFKINDALHP